MIDKWIGKIVRLKTTPGDRHYTGLVVGSWDENSRWLKILRLVPIPQGTLPVDTDYFFAYPELLCEVKKETI